MPHTHDWLPALDDSLCYRLRWCTLCGRAAMSGAVAIWEGPQRLAVSYLLCPSCLGTDSKRAHQAVTRKLHERYKDAC